MKLTLDLATLEGIARAQARKGVRSAVGQGVAILRGDILSRPGGGRIYGRRKHRASAPGEPPAVDTGNLRNHIEGNEPGVLSDGTVLGRIVANTEYAEALEVGTERMAARPYLSRLFDEHAPALLEAFWSGAKSAD